ncbi:MAG TPA: amino acid adenylation domain-containing protein [Polyangia bacterium]|nr:amino acid adenylation domain-containing protein [Polyangia bacterium]
MSSAGSADEKSTPDVTAAEEDVYVFPASYSQQRLWFLDQLQPGSSAYNVPTIVRLRGPLDAPAFARALDEVVARHESLRTTFGSEAGVPVQVVAPALALGLAVEDLSALPADARETALARALAEGAAAPFDLKRGPLVRARLLRVAPDDHVFLFNASHIVVDGISTAVIFDELSKLYEAFAAGRPSPLPELAIQFADYAIWQKETMQGEELERRLAHWRERLAGELPTVELPSDRPRPSTMTGKGARLRARLATRAGADALAALCRQERTTSFSGLLAAFSLLVARHTGQTDILLGSPFGNRARAEIEQAVGFYAATVVLRVDVSGDPTFRELLGRARDVILGAAANQDVPFEKIVEALKPARDAAHNPFFQIMLGYLSAPDDALVFPGVEVTAVDPPSVDSMFDLLAQLEEGRGGLSGYFTYSTELYDAPTIARFVDGFARVLAAAVASPDEKISRLPVIGEVERALLLDTWNDTDVEVPIACVHTLFEQQAARTPTRIAARTGADALTYEDLDRRANQLARRLKALGTGPDGLVGIALPRGPRLLTAVLATHKAGGAYVPLDPTYPTARLAQMIGDSQVPVIVTTTEIAKTLPLNGARALCLDAPDEVAAREALSASPEDGGARPEHLAYVIYTSGSTGTPKGVMLEHRLVANFFAGMDAVLGASPAPTALDTPPGVWLAVTSLSFDISVLELLWTVARGFTVVIQAEDDKAGAFAGEVEANGVTHFQCTPSMASLLVADPAGRAALGKLKKMLVGGEALPPALARELRAALGGELIDMYGPTETTIWSTAYTVTDDTILIGRPIANTTVYVLDANRAPVPVGVAGELYIGGAGLARGYLRRPELTDERFVPNPFGAGRLYRTGDLCRFRGDGNLEYLGRLDHQVKIRGHRIELGEIETNLRELAGAREVVVVARADAPGDVRLVAYMAGFAGAPPATAELRRGLRERLPEPMVPSAFVVLERLPLTPNGKIDRKALPAPSAVAGAAAPVETADDGFVAPRTPTEQVIAGIWREVLGVPRVSVFDNFFDLGGHSLLSTQVVFQIEQRLKKRLNVAELILQNLAQVATKCDQAPAVDAGKGKGVFGALKRIISKA